MESHTASNHHPTCFWETADTCIMTSNEDTRQDRLWRRRERDRLRRQMETAEEREARSINPGIKVYVVSFAQNHLFNITLLQNWSCITILIIVEAVNSWPCCFLASSCFKVVWMDIIFLMVNTSKEAPYIFLDWPVMISIIWKIVIYLKMYNTGNNCTITTQGCPNMLLASVK